MKRGQIARLIKSKIEAIGIEELKEKYQSSGKINHLIIDNLLPDEISEHYINNSHRSLVSSKRETRKKYVGVQFLNIKKL